MANFNFADLRVGLALSSFCDKHQLLLVLSGKNYLINGMLSRNFIIFVNRAKKRNVKTGNYYC